MVGRYSCRNTKTYEGIDIDQVVIETYVDTEKSVDVTEITIYLDDGAIEVYKAEKSYD